MKFTAVATIAMAAMTSATDIPACAQSCIDDCVKSSTNCAPNDYACLCKNENFSKIQTGASACIMSNCGADVTMNQVLPASQKLCAEAVKDGPSSAPASTQMVAYETESCEPTETAQPTETQPAEPEPVDTECPTTMDTQPSPSANGTSPPPPPVTSAPVTAGAAGLAPIGGLAILAIGALAL